MSNPFPQLTGGNLNSHFVVGDGYKIYTGGQPISADMPEVDYADPHPDADPIKDIERLGAQVQALHHLLSSPPFAPGTAAEAAVIDSITAILGTQAMLAEAVTQAGEAVLSEDDDDDDMSDWHGEPTTMDQAAWIGNMHQSRAAADVTSAFAAAGRAFGNMQAKAAAAAAAVEPPLHDLTLAKIAGIVNSSIINTGMLISTATRIGLLQATPEQREAREQFDRRLAVYLMGELRVNWRALGGK